jgi:hypothetical protein
MVMVKVASLSAAFCRPLRTLSAAPCNEGPEPPVLIKGKAYDKATLDGPEIKWADNQEAVTFLGYRPTRS